MDAIILHGTLGSPTGNWFGWLAQELKGVGIDSYVPTLPTPQGQDLEGWMSAVEEQCPPQNGGTILVGHSLGAVLALRLLERSRQPVHSTILVSPPLDEIGIREIDVLNSSFLEHPFDWGKIRANSGNLRFFMGDDDQYVPQSQLHEIARRLDVHPIVVAGGGHLNSETGFNSFPQLLMELRRMVEAEIDPLDSGQIRR